MLPLRFPWVWRLLGWLLVLGVVTGSLVPGEALSGVSVSDKVMHAGSYFLLMVWFAGLYRRKWHLAIAAGLLGLGLGLDLLQLATATRQFDPKDVLANAFGILAGLVLSISLLEGWCLRIERLLPAPNA